MNKNKDSYKNPKARQLSFKRSHFVLFMCIVITAVLAITMINNQFASAGNSLQMSENDTPDYPIHQRNYTDSISCNLEGCHDQLPQPWIEVIKIDETPSDVTYTVDGQTDTWQWIEGWAVLDDNENNEERGFGPGEFTIQKSDENETYTVYWVDSDTELFGRGGSNYTEIIVPKSENRPPSPPEITGPPSGYVGKTINYQFVSIDPDGDNVFYKIDWGDGVVDDWFGEFPSGQPQTKSHIWSEPGIYTIRAIARDINGLEGKWNSLDVNITIQPFEPKLKIRLKMASIGKISVNFQNKGEGDLSDIQYTVTAKGGLFRLTKRIDFTENGTIDDLPAGEKTLVSIPHESLKLRFCVAMVIVTATTDGKTFTHNQFVVVLGRFVFARPILPLQPLSEPSNPITAYGGQLRVYVVEPVSRWDDYDGNPYHYGFLDLAVDEKLSIDYNDSYNKQVTWDAQQAGYDNVEEDNIMVIAAIFNPKGNIRYSLPPNSNPFGAHFVDAAAAATPGITGENTVTDNFTHTVFVEEGTGTWCVYCPIASENLYTIFNSSDYPFYFVALIEDMAQKAEDRLEDDYNILGYPTCYFDGGYEVEFGAGDVQLNLVVLGMFMSLI
jgi:hypothetical protein